MKESKIIKIIIILCLFLAIGSGWAFFARGWVGENNLLGKISLLDQNKIEKFSLLKVLPQLAGFDQEMTYLLLFQNNLELRPSGGYLGNFGIVKIENGKINHLGIHDTNIFDGFGKVVTEPPYSFKEYLNVNNWQMRDSNWSPDFSVAAQKAEYFYHLQGGEEEFDGIIAVNASLLPHFIDFSGPIYLAEFNKEFVAEDALYQLEYEVEKGYVSRGIKEGERKTVFKALAEEIINQLADKGIWGYKELSDLIMDELDKKNILLFFKDESLQQIAEEQNWAGRIENTERDYLMIVEANLGAKKSNLFIEREVEYYVDLDQKQPTAKLTIRYTHSNPVKDWFNNDYSAYLRIFTPVGSYLTEAKGVSDKTRFKDELDKKVFGNWIQVIAGKSQTVEFYYDLPANVIKDQKYEILVQKQSGLTELPFELIVKKDNQEIIREKNITNFWEEVIEF